MNENQNGVKSAERVDSRDARGALHRKGLIIAERSPSHGANLLSDALAGLASLCSSDVGPINSEQMNLLRRHELSAIFEVLHDYSSAIARALPD